LASFHRVPLSGTVGVFRYLIKKNFISTKEANDLLEQMRDYGYYSPVPNIEDLF
jgi:predicted nucleic acid-binding protein